MGQYLMRFRQGGAALHKAVMARDKYCRWHRWFAWRPVKLDGGKEWAWLEMLNRRAGCVGESPLGFFVNAPLDCRYKSIDG